MKRTVSSLSPMGARSDSMSVVKPYLYFSPTLSTVSTVSRTAAISMLHFRKRGRNRTRFRNLSFFTCAFCDARPARREPIYFIFGIADTKADADRARRQRIVHAHRGQIGRASCRERVCQYV